MLEEIDPLIRPLDVEALREQFIHAEPFPFIVMDDFLEESFVREIVGAYPSVDEAGSMGRTFHAVNEQGKTQITDPARFAAAVTKLNGVLASPAWLQALERITGIPKLLADEKLDGGGMHIMRSDSHLDVHIDFNLLVDRRLHRRLNILVFFNEGWKEEWGGRLELWDRDVKERHHAFVPRLNRCVVFQTSQISYHGVEHVHCPPDRARHSFAAYYYTEEPPEAWDGRRHSTVFRARPEETAKRWLWMPAARAGRIVRKALQRLTGRRS